LCPTRWTLRYTALQSLKDLLIPVHAEIEHICEDSSCDRETRAKAAGFAHLLSQFNFYMMLHVACKLFEITDRLSKVLQQSTISACEGMKAADAVVTTLQLWRSDEDFHALFEEAVVLSATLDADRPAVPRQKSVPRRLDDGSQGHNFSAPKITIVPYTSESSMKQLVR